jgi:predicted transcriptional regulator
MAPKMDRSKPLEKRYTVSFDREQSDRLEEMARANNVTVSWVVRAAVEAFLRKHRDPQLRLEFQPPLEE